MTGSAWLRCSQPAALLLLLALLRLLLLLRCACSLACQ
jgi:hypothetical protein